jgi:hypothetical protein
LVDLLRALGRGSDQRRRRFPIPAINIATPASAAQLALSSLDCPGTVQPHPGNSGVPATHWSCELQLIASPHGSPKFAHTPVAASEVASVGDASEIGVSETESEIGASVVVESVAVSVVVVSSTVVSVAGASVVVPASVSSIGTSATIASLVSAAVASASEPESPVSEAPSRPASAAVAQVDPLHPAAPHETIVAAQAPDPLHAFVVATEPAQVGAAHCASGSVPDVMLAQVPVVCPVWAFVHAVQIPVHLVSQQVPSTQLVEEQSEATVHALPLLSGPPHTPPGPQTFPVAQSASLAHVVLHAPLAHA